MSDTTNKVLRLAEINANVFASTRGKGLDPSGVAFRDIHTLWAGISGGGGGNYQIKTAVPSDVDVEIVADDGYDALAQVLVEAAANVKPWNIPEGITMFGVTGTMKVKVGAEWPDELPATEEEMDEAAQEDDPDIDKEDYMLLVDNEGNITKGYLYTAENSGMMVYNGTVVPKMPEYDKQLYPYVAYFKDLSFVESSAVWIASSVPITFGSEEWDSNEHYSASGRCIVGFYDESKWLPNPGWVSIEEEASFNLYMGTPVVWSNHDITHYKDGSVYFNKCADPIPYTGFEITWYDPATTEFKAVGWRRVSKHTTGANAGQITSKDFTLQASGGWNYLKNIRSCTREKLYYKGVEVWPNNLYTGMWSYNGVELPALPYNSWDVDAYPYIMIANNEATGIYGLVASPEPLTVEVKDEGWIFYTCNGNIIHFYYFGPESGEGWTWKSDSIGNSISILREPVWSNYDITHQDGSLYFKKSADPTPI